MLIPLSQYVGDELSTISLLNPSINLYGIISLVNFFCTSMWFLGLELQISCMICCMIDKLCGYVHLSKFYDYVVDASKIEKLVFSEEV